MNLNKTRSVSTGTGRTVTLIGDGTTTPELLLDGITYVDAGDLKRIGKTLLKWGKKLHKEELAS